MMENYITLRKAVEQKLLSEEDCARAVYLLTIFIKKMQYESHGGGHFNINPDTVLILKEQGIEVKVELLGKDAPHLASNGNPDFDTEALNHCFRAPESFLGLFTPASDVYSMGMLLAYMIQGFYPYKINESMSRSEIMRVVKETEPTLKVSPQIDLLIYKAIDKKAGKRFKDAEEMGFSLMDYLGIEKPKNFSCFSDNKKRKIGIGKDGKRIGGNRCIIDKEEKPQTGQEPRIQVNIEPRDGEGFKAVAGMADLKKKLRRDFVDVVSNKELAKEFGILPPNMLFYGPPGTGKTYISMRLAEESQLAFCSIKPSDLASVWVHGSQMLIKQLFERATSLAEKNDRGCLLLIDEFDSIAPKRTVEDNSHQAGEVAELLTQLNDCVEKNVYVIGTTNRLDAIDPGILRHGRLDSIVYFNIPDLECRKQLFEIELLKRPHEENISIDELGRLTEGYTSSDISYMVKETAMNAFEASLRTDDKHVVKISEKMLKEVIAGTRSSVTRDDIRRYEKMRDDDINHSRNERPRIGFLT